MTTFEIKKRRVTWEKVLMKDIHPKKEVLTTAEKNSWFLKCDTPKNPENWIGAKYSFTNYQEEVKTIKTIIHAPIELKTEKELEDHVQLQVKQFEVSMQEQERFRLAVIEFKLLDEYEEEP